MRRETLPSLRARSALGGRAVLVTGASGAFGSATLRLARELGASALGLDLKPADGVLACDVTDGAQVRDAVAEAIGQHAYHRDPTASHIQYAYTEIADECRHTVMFARLIRQLGAQHDRLDPFAHICGWVLKTFSNGPLTFAAALFVEELLDQGQREIMKDESLEPLMRAVYRIHVTEEARHMRYAREELVRIMPAQPWPVRAVSRIALAAIAALAADRLISPAAYQRAGLDPKQAKRAARRNPHRRASAAWLARQAVATFQAAGLIEGPARHIWRAAGLLNPAGA